MGTKAPRKWVPKPGARITKKQAQFVGEALDGLRESGEEVTPRNLLDLARDDRSPLHKLFEWDDDIAAEEFRIYQARKLIGGVHMISINNKPVKGFHSIEFEGEEVTHEYVRHDLVIEDDASISQVSRDLYSDIEAAVRKAVDLGLQKRSKPWREIQKAVYGNRPGL